VADLLVYTPDNELNNVVEQLGEAHGYRVRCCRSVTKASDWLEIRDFDAMVLHSRIPLEQQQLLAGMLWKRNLSALFFVFDFEDRRHQVPEMRLLGAEVIKGPDALARLGAELRRHADVRPKDPADFRVLVVEDLESPRDIICIFIESLGYPAVVGAGSAMEALNLLNHDPKGFSCILTDIRMPYMSGKELIEAVRSDDRHKNIPIIVLTAFGTADCLIDCLRAGASGFLVKPPKKADMQRELARAKRLLAHGLDPRLIREGELDVFREALHAKGYV